MNKKLIFLFAFIPFLGFSWTKILKENGGFFGYKTVSYSVTGPNSILACSDPGKTNCSISNAIIQTDTIGNIISDDLINEIDNAITDKLSQENLEGSFTYLSYFIKFQYNIEQNKLEYIIYTLAEANELGIN